MIDRLQNKSSWDRATEKISNGADLKYALEEFGPGEGRAAVAFAYQNGAGSVRLVHEEFTFVEYWEESGSGDDWMMYTVRACLG